MTASEPAHPPAPAPATFADGEPQHLHWTSPVLHLLLLARQFVLPLLVAAVSSGGSVVFLAVVVVGFVLALAWRLVAWRRFTYRVVDGALVIEQGILQRSRRELPVSRIQQVDLRRRLRHRVLGVAVVRIDTAGGGSGAEVTLEAIADDQALALRGALLWRAERPAAPEPAARGASAPRPAGPEAVVVAHLTTRDLVVAGVTGSRLATAIPLAGAAFGLLNELPDAVAQGLFDRVPEGTGVVVAAVVLALPLLLLFAVVSSVLTDHDYTLVRIGSDLHLRRGLLDQREATISLHRVQVVHLVENPLRRALGLASIQLQSAGSGHEAEGAVSRITVPSIRRDRFDALLAEVLPTAVHRPDLVPAPPAARRRAWLRRTGPIVVAAALAGAVTRSPWAALVLLLVVPLGVAAELAYRNLGHTASPTLVVARNGGWVRHTALVPVAKAQSTRLSSTPFQRRAGLATLHLAVAGRGHEPRITDGDAGRLRTLRRAALHTAAAHHDEDAVRRRLRADVDAETDADARELDLRG